MTPLHTTLRIGHGYDLHRLEPRPPAGAGRDLIIGGVPLEFPRGPLPHPATVLAYFHLLQQACGFVARE